jgi:Uncharacterized protein conserved in bacteria (DUF2141)
MEQRAREVELVFRNAPKGTYAVSDRHDENINGGIRFPGGLHA